MIEIKLKDNKTDKKILVNDIYDYKAIPQDKMYVLILALERQFDDYAKSKNKGKKKKQIDMSS